MWPVIYAVIGVTVFLLVFYLGWELQRLKKGIEDREEYIRKTGAILGAFMGAIQRGEDLEKLVDKIESSSDAELLELYNQNLPKRPNS